MKAQLFRGALWIGATRLAVNAIGLVSTIVLARLLVPEDFGLVAIASACALVISTISEMSLTNALVQHEDPQPAHYDTAFTLNLLRGALLALAIALAGWPLSVMFGDVRLFYLMTGFAAGNMISCIANPRLAILERALEFRQWIILSGGEKLAGFLVAALVAYVFRSYWALAAGAITSQMMRTAASYAVIRYRPRLSLRHYRELLSFSVWLMFAQLVQAVSYRADPVVFGAFLPTQEVGHFSLGSRVSSLVVNEVLQPISYVLFPAFSRMRKEPGRLRAAYLRAQGLLCLVAMPVGWGLAATAEPLVRIVLGNGWLPAVPVIQFLAVTAAFQRTNELYALAMATGRTDALFRRDLRGLCIRVPLVVGGLALGPAAGLGSLVGALAGHLLSSCINSVLNMQAVSRLCAISMRDQLSLVWRPAIAAAGMALIVSALAEAVPEDAVFVTRAVSLALSTATGIAVYGLILAGVWLLAGRPRGAEAEVIQLTCDRLRRFSLRP